MTASTCMRRPSGSRGDHSSGPAHAGGARADRKDLRPTRVLDPDPRGSAKPSDPAERGTRTRRLGHRAEDSRSRRRARHPHLPADGVDHIRPGALPRRGLGDRESWWRRRSVPGPREPRWLRGHLDRLPARARNEVPGPVEDAYASVSWVARQAADLGIDPARIASGGSSAGGNLAVAAALMARDRGGPAVAFHLLVVPVADLRYGARSHADFAVGYGLTKADMEWYASHYLAKIEDADHPYASVARADLRDMPPAFVITAECDPLRDDGELYASKLRELGIAASAKRYPGMFHGFMAYPDLLPEAREALDDAGAALRAALG